MSFKLQSNIKTNQIFEFPIKFQVIMNSCSVILAVTTYLNRPESTSVMSPMTTFELQWKCKSINCDVPCRITQKLLIIDKFKCFNQILRPFLHILWYKTCPCSTYNNKTSAQNSCGSKYIRLFVCCRICSIGDGRH